jgi:hypothetical protein
MVGLKRRLKAGDAVTHKFGWHGVVTGETSAPGTIHCCFDEIGEYAAPRASIRKGIWH